MVSFDFIKVMDNPRVGSGFRKKSQNLLAQDRDRFFKKVEEYIYKYAMNDV